MTQADLAAHLTVPRELVGRWETSGAPRADRVQLMDVLGVELSDLVDHDNPFTERRLRAELSQQRLAELAGVPRSTVQALEAGTAAPASSAAWAVETVLADARAEPSPSTRAPAGRPGLKSPSAPARPGPAQLSSPPAAGVRWRPGALREARKAAGLTQAEVAAELGVTREAVGRWEAGTAPRLERISEIASVLGLDDGGRLVEGAGEQWVSLTALRVQAGLSQRRLAERAGLKRSSIQAVERSAFHPTEAMVTAYAEVCGVPVATVRNIVAKKD